MRHRQPRELRAQRTSAVSTPANGQQWLDASAKHRARQRELKELFHADQYVPAEPVADYLAVGLSGLRLLIAKGLPCHRLSARVRRFKKSEVVQWINARPC